MKLSIGYVSRPKCRIINPSKMWPNSNVWEKSNKTKLLSRRNEQQIRFREYLLSFCSEPFVFSSPLQKQDLTMKIHVRNDEKDQSHIFQKQSIIMYTVHIMDGIWQWNNQSNPSIKYFHYLTESGVTFEVLTFWLYTCIPMSLPSLKTSLEIIFQTSFQYCCHITHTVFRVIQNETLPGNF